jgi:hypothetical protein
MSAAGNMESGSDNGAVPHANPDAVRNYVDAQRELLNPSAPSRLWSATPEVREPSVVPEIDQSSYQPQPSSWRRVPTPAQFGGSSLSGGVGERDLQAMGRQFSFYRRHHRPRTLTIRPRRSMIRAIPPIRRRHRVPGGTAI